VSVVLVFLIVLLVVAFFTKLDVFFYLLYALVGFYILGRLWARRSLASVTISRSHDQRAFLGEPLTVQVKVQNGSWLPVLWLRLGDTVPAGLGTGATFRHILSLLPREEQDLSYTLYSRRRGYYPFGPLVSRGGDLLGTNTYENRYEDDDYVIVYPKIIPLQELGFPSHSPSGNLPSRERLFEDPSRIRGVRDYQPGDSLKRMDWKTSARVGKLQVRRLEPAIALETAIFLNLSRGDYPPEQRLAATELGIVVAASLAVHVVEMRQAVGLYSNGLDPLADETQTMPSVPLRKGREHLMNLLDLLARIELPSEDSETPFLTTLGRRSLGLPWGSTVVVITAQEVEGLLDTLLALRRRGMLVILVLTYAHRGFRLTAQRAEQIGIQTLQIWTEKDLDVWR
jgi:uncharacterized protein (DUF58 family)